MISLQGMAYEGFFFLLHPTLGARLPVLGPFHVGVVTSFQITRVEKLNRLTSIYKSPNLFGKVNEARLLSTVL